MLYLETHCVQLFETQVGLICVFERFYETKVTAGFQWSMFAGFISSTCFWCIFLRISTSRKRVDEGRSDGAGSGYLCLLMRVVSWGTKFVLIRKNIEIYFI
jgi:hypothetical protein